jgi:predicted nuclease of predicted toxin-antitoxin system
VKIKVDENVGTSGIDLLRQAGQDVMTVREQGLAGAADEVIFQACVAEGRALITLDHDFGQVPRFPPQQAAGIVVLELGGPASLRGLHDRLRDFLSLAAVRSVSGELWIVEPGRVRIHLEKDAEW